MVPNTQCSSFSQADVGTDPWKIRNETLYCVPDDEIPLFTLLTLNFWFHFELFFVRGRKLGYEGALNLKLAKHRMLQAYGS
jgi:hypothetical protein